MRIALALLRYFPYGGAQRDALRTAIAARDAGHEVVAHVRRWDGPVPEGLEVRRLDVGGRTNHGRARRFGAALGEAVRGGGVDAVIGFDKLPGLDAYFAADPCFVARAHEARSALYRLTPRCRALSRLEAQVFAPEHATRILLIDPRQRAVYARWHGTQAERFVDLPPGVAPDRRAGPDAPALRTALRAELDLGDDEALLLLLGSDFRRKGLDRALRALAALPDARRARTRLLAVGTDDPGPFRSLARSLGVEARLTILPGRDDVPALLQGADLLIHPAYVENTGTVLVEALAAGLPVLCTGACGYAPHVADARAGAVVPEPFAQAGLDAALARLLGADGAALRERALAWAAGTDLDAMHRRIVETLEDVHARRRAERWPPVGLV